MDSALSQPNKQGYALLNHACRDRLLTIVEAQISFAPCGVGNY